MVAYTYIESTLYKLDSLYNKCKSQREAIYYSKLALIELCGWIEEAIDDIVLRHAKKKLNNKNFKLYKKNIVNKTSSFEYEYRTKPMISNLIGLVILERIENKLDKTNLINSYSSITSILKKKRNEAAHQHLKGVTRTFDAPSFIIGYYNTVKPTIKAIEKNIKEL